MAPFPKLKPKIQGAIAAWTALFLFISLGFESKTPEASFLKELHYFRRFSLSISFL
jgi:hypothetical protein